MDIKSTDILTIIAGPILIYPFITGYTYIGAVFIYGTIIAYFRYVRNSNVI